MKCRTRGHGIVRTDITECRPRAQRRAVWASERPDRPVRDRNVGAFFLLRHDVAARFVPGEISAAARTGRVRVWLWRREGGAGKRVRAARRAAPRLANLRFLYRLCVSHADTRRLAGGSRVRSTH